MAVYVSTSCLANGSDVFPVLETYAQAGLTNVELGASHRYVNSLSSATFEQYDFNFIVHHYFPPAQESFILNLASQDRTILERSKNQIKRSIEFCHSLGVELFTLHAGFRVDPDDQLRFPRDQPASPYEAAFGTFVNAIEEIDRHARAKGIRIAIENNVLSEYNLVKGQNPFLLLCEAEEFERLWNVIPSPNVGMLLDLGHLKVTSHWLSFDKCEFINKVKNRVLAIHIHDNNGQLDEHKKLDEASWCLEAIGREPFINLPIVLESTSLTIDEIVQQVSLVEGFLEKEQR
jgi:sugar phosphate isomerase/epimerase